MTIKLDISRRHFLQLGAGALAASSVLGRSGARRALAAASPGGYKALVCLHLNGGNDGHNWVVPISQPTYGLYAAARGDLALPRSALLPLKGAAPNGVTYGLHPSCRELQALFNSGSAAIVGNVGPLIQPTTRAQALAGSVSLPPQIFSHLNQVTEWQTGVPQSVAPYGWGGKVSDQFVSQGITPNLSFNISMVGSNIWQQGRLTNPYTLGTSGAASLRAAGDAAYRNGLRQKATLGLIDQAAGDSNLLVSAAATIFQSAADKVALLNSAIAAAGPVTTAFPAPQTNDWNLSLQLREVAQVIKAHQQIGDSRQLFFVEMGGFDTHYNELATQAQLLRYVSQYVDAFWSAVTEMGLQQDVTLFTMSDFGRTLTSNGAGADHGWGNHHMVLGGAVQGGRFYGSMPELTLGGPDDFGQGRLLPTTSADQYAATLANWLGVSDANLNSIFTNLANFPTRNLGFMG
jgi:uncharacterized protein (DUF1501 family)